MTCVFCDIVAGAAAASVVAETESVVAFADLFPVNPGHQLVVPRTHAVGLADLDPADGAEMFRVAQQIAVALPGAGVRCEGVNLFLADGAVAGQEVFHAHLHVIPRFPGDAFRLSSGQRRTPAPRAELDATAAAVRRGLGP